VADDFEIVDETYLCPYAEDAIQPLLRTDFKPIDVNFPGRYAKGWRHLQYYEVPAFVLENGEDLTTWARTAIAAAERSKDANKTLRPCVLP
jgi:hypothetical protein